MNWYLWMVLGAILGVVLFVLAIAGWIMYQDRKRGPIPMESDPEKEDLDLMLGKKPAICATPFIHELMPDEPESDGNQKKNADA